MKKILTIIMAVLMAAGLLLQAAPLQVRADDEVTENDEADSLEKYEGVTVKDGTVYCNVNEMGRFKDRTFQQVMERLTLARHEDYAYWKDRTSWFDSMPSIVNPYSEGVLAKETLQIMHDMIDFWRWMVGVAPLAYESNGTAELQKGALVRNFHFAHSVDSTRKPADMPDKLWNEGAAAQHGIIAMGFKPDEAITGWLNEGYNLATGQFTQDFLGHRYALLNRGIGGVDLGYAGNVTIGRSGYLYDENDPSGSYMGAEVFTAFPSPGDFPSWLLNYRLGSNMCAWSLEWNDQLAGVPEGNTVSVTITDLDTQSSYVCTEENGKLLVNGRKLTIAQPDEGGNLHYQHSYKVEVTGLAEAKYNEEKYETDYSGRPVVISYTIEFHASALDVKSRELVLGKGEKVNLEITDGSGSGAVTVMSADPEIASVDAQGNVTGRKFGDTVITVSNAAGDSVEVNVKVCFKDVTDPSKSTYKTIYWGADNGVISGFNDGTFRPQDNCTRGQFAIMLWRMAGKPSADGEARAFSDVNSSMSYYRAISWASAVGIVNGFSDGTFRPDDPLTRAQIVIMVWRYLGKEDAESANSFTDVPAGNTTYRAVQWASENGIVRGYGDGTFQPENNCTREQIVTILYRAVREGFMEVA